MPKTDMDPAHLGYTIDVALRMAMFALAKACTPAEIALFFESMNEEIGEDKGARAFADKVLLPAKKGVELLHKGLTPNEKTDEAQAHICGSEIEFSLYVPMSKLREVAEDIWEHPSRYFSDVIGEKAYYQHLKLLWVEYPGGAEERLANLVKGGK